MVTIEHGVSLASTNRTVNEALLTAAMSMSGPHIIVA